MKTKILLATAVFAVAGLAFAGAASAAFVAIYRNALETTAQRSEVVKMAGKECSRGGAKTTLLMTVGKLTEECAYKTPVVGSDLEIAATGAISSATPEKVAKKAFLGLQMRAGGGGKLELRVFPGQKKAQIARVTEEGIKYLAIAKNIASIKEPNKALVLRLRVIEGSGEAAGTCKIGGYLSGELVIEAEDPACGELEGEATALSAGATNNGVGVIASFAAIVVRVPVRF
jgi:hypothetical protein